MYDIAYVHLLVVVNAKIVKLGFYNATALHILTHKRVINRSI